MIIATRILTISDQERKIDVPVRINSPEFADNHWRCAFEIGWPEGVERGDAGGFDGMQALYLAMQRIASALYMSPYHQAGQLAWTKPGDGYGFPMSRGGRDELIGEDRAFYS